MERGCFFVGVWNSLSLTYDIIEFLVVSMKGKHWLEITNVVFFSNNSIKLKVIQWTGNVVNLYPMSAGFFLPKSLFFTILFHYFFNILWPPLHNAPPRIFSVIKRNVQSSWLTLNTSMIQPIEWAMGLTKKMRFKYINIYTPCNIFWKTWKNLVKVHQLLPTDWFWLFFLFQNVSSDIQMCRHHSSSIEIQKCTILAKKKSKLRNFSTFFFTFFNFLIEDILSFF